MEPVNARFPEVWRAVLGSAHALEGFELETVPLMAEPESRAQLGAALHGFLMARHAPDVVTMAWREHFALEDSTR